MTRKNIVKIIYIVAILFLFVGVSYTIANLFGDLQGNKITSLDMGDITFTYNEPSNALTLNDAEPLTDSDGKVQEETFDFSVVMNTTRKMNIFYNIYITMENGNTLPLSVVKFYLTDGNDNELLAPTLGSNLENFEYEINSKFIYMNKFNEENHEGETTHNYRLRMWIDEGYNEYDTTVEGNKQSIILGKNMTFAFKVNVDTNEHSSHGCSILVSNQEIEEKTKTITILSAATSLDTNPYSWDNTTYTPTNIKTINENGTYYGYVKELDGTIEECSVSVTSILPTRTLTINPNGGTYNGVTTNSTLEIMPNTPTTLGRPSKENYVFAGWTVSGATINDMTVTMGNTPATATASWITIGDINKTYTYSGNYIKYPILVEGYYTIELWGASPNNSANTYISGKPTYGGYTAGRIYLNTTDNIYVYVGGTGQIFNCCTTQSGSARSGGATDVRVVNGTWNDATSLSSRIMVAGGGGGTYADSSGGVGGSAGGLRGYPTTIAFINTGSTQTSGGTAQSGGTAGGFGYGGTNTVSAYTPGGGGWYGGGSGPSGSGGSSYISGHTGCVTVQAVGSTAYKTGCSTGTTTKSCSEHPNGYVFTNTSMIDGKGIAWTNVSGSAVQMKNPVTGGLYALNVGHTGNGYAKISWYGY